MFSITATLVTDHTSEHRTVESVAVFCLRRTELKLPNGATIYFPQGQSYVYGEAKDLLAKYVLND